MNDKNNVFNLINRYGTFQNYFYHLDFPCLYIYELNIKINKIKRLNSYVIKIKQNPNQTNPNGCNNIIMTSSPHR